MIEEIKPRNRKHWLELRTQGIGGSDIPTLMGVNRYGSWMSVYESKIGIDNVFSDDSIARMAAGKMLEATIVRMFKKAKPEFKVVNPQLLYRRADNPIAFGTPDRLLTINGNVQAVLEIKNTEYWSREKRIVATYQTQWYMYVLDLQYGFVCALEKGWKLHTQAVIRDNTLIEQMKETADRFWSCHIVPRIPPSNDTVDEIDVL